MADIKTTLRKLSIVETTDDRGCYQFKMMVHNSERYGWLVPGQEALSRTLLLAATLGDDVAAAQLHDLLDESGMEGKAKELDRRLPSFREAVSTWTPETRRTFLRHCREKGVFRQRDLGTDSRGRKAPRTSAKTKPAATAV